MGFRSAAAPCPARSVSNARRFATSLALVAATLLGAGWVQMLASPVHASETVAEEPREVHDPSFFESLEARNIGPFRGGRSVAVAGVIQDPLTYYMGTTGGGLWRTTDAGLTWKNLSDGHFATGSVGAVAVAPSDPNVVWVGMGEACIRGVMTTHGDGVYRSTDRGKTWTHSGLELSRHISKVLVHPTDPDVAWVGVQGEAWGPSEERGVYRTTDGGATWERTLYVDATTGVSDLALDVTNPRILYAALWRHRRVPWKMVSGAEEGEEPTGGIHKSTDGGRTWQKLEKGLPANPGKIGVAVSPADPERVFAIVEAEKGGLYRSDDGGESWQRVNDERVIQTRSWYYMHVFADPQNADTVWVLNAPALKSIDGGKSFSRVATPHGDNHDLWIHPHQPRYMINANDGGANVSTNGGRTWSTQANQPTAQFYRVAVDNRVPYWVYGGQQDNSAIAITSRATDDSTIHERHWHDIAGCESADPAFDPDDPRYVYGGCYQGIVSEWDARTHRTRDVMAYPYLGLSVAPRETRYRFNWNAPLLVSHHDPSVIYHAGNVVLRSSNRGQSWQEISPDLTRDQEDLQDHGGGPITSEGAGGEIYGTILSLVESSRDARELWVGTDDGRVQLTRDGGESWQDVSPFRSWAGAGDAANDAADREEDGATGREGAMINTIELSPHAAGTAYLAVQRHKWQDYRPLIYATTDYGSTWTALGRDLPSGTLVRAVREDPRRPGLLYAGTENGLFVSWDGGERWQNLQLGLPIVPITDLLVHRDDLVLATQGRSFWIVDDLTPVRQVDQVAADSLALLAPRETLLLPGGSTGRRGAWGANPSSGVVVYYRVPEAEEEADDEAGTDAGRESDDAPPPLGIEVFDAENRLVRQVSSDEKDDGVSIEPGLQRWVWDLRYQVPAEVEGLAVFGPSTPTVGPGTYRIRLSRGSEVRQAEAVVSVDPRGDLGPSDYAPRRELIVGIRDSLHRLYDMANRLDAAKTQVENLLERLADHEASEPLTEAGEALVEAIEELDDQLLQRDHRNFQDIINYPARLNGELAFLLSAADDGPPVNEGVRERFDELESRLDGILEQAETLLARDLAEFDALFDQHAIPAVILPNPEPSMPEAIETESAEVEVETGDGP